MREKLLFLLIAGLLGALSSQAGETASVVDAATKKAVLAQIERYVQEDVRLKDSFLILDPRSGTPLRLTFDHVHEGVNTHPAGYVACVDFKDASGKIYDVDVVVGPDARQIQEVFLHKVDGKAVTAEKKTRP